MPDTRIDWWRVSADSIPKTFTYFASCRRLIFPCSNTWWADVTVMDDEQFAPSFVDEDVHGLRPGYINQEIVKMAFWEQVLPQLLLR